MIGSALMTGLLAATAGRTPAEQCQTACCEGSMACPFGCSIVRGDSRVAPVVAALYYLCAAQRIARADEDVKRRLERRADGGGPAGRPQGERPRPPSSARPSRSVSAWPGPISNAWRYSPGRRATVGRLAELTGLTTGSATRMVDRLEQAGYVDGSGPGDRRRSWSSRWRSDCQVGALHDSIRAAQLE